LRERGYLHTCIALVCLGWFNQEDISDRDYVYVFCGVNQTDKNIDAAAVKFALAALEFELAKHSVKYTPNCFKSSVDEKQDGTSHRFTRTVLYLDDCAWPFEITLPKAWTDHIDEEMSLCEIPPLPATAQPLPPLLEAAPVMQPMLEHHN
jgi:hypothetical protein